MCTSAIPLFATVVAAPAQKLYPEDLSELCPDSEIRSLFKLYHESSCGKRRRRTGTVVLVHYPYSLAMSRVLLLGISHCWFSGTGYRLLLWMGLFSMPLWSFWLPVGCICRQQPHPGRLALLMDWIVKGPLWIFWLLSKIQRSMSWRLPIAWFYLGWEVLPAIECKCFAGWPV